MIAIVDYRAGNLSSVKRALDYLGVQSVVTSSAEIVAQADKVVLPGVGHFSATAVLHQTGLQAAISEQLKRNVPFLGICVGMQWMFETSEESDPIAGAAIFPGRCERFLPTVKSPHVGWNSLECSGSSRLLRGIDSGSFVYFTHSYRAPVIEATVALTDYGGEFCAAVEQGHLFGVQFHPEKSGRTGLKLLQNFCEL